MIRISGYVTLQKEDIVIPGLVVAAYDTNKPLKELLKEHKNEKGFKETLIDQLGNSISSVLTDNDGKFVITTEDLQFEGNKPRPDLIIIVYAPEDTQGIEVPVPRPPNERILYISAAPRNDAGAEEAYKIRLLKAQLEKFNIPYDAASREIKKVNNAYAANIDMIDNSEDLRKKLKLKIKTKLTDQVQSENKIEKHVKQKLKNFSTVPLALRDRPFMLINAKDLKTVQKKAGAEGIKKISNFENTFKIRLSNNDLDALGIKRNEHNEEGGKINTADMIDKIKSLTGGVDLIRRYDIQPSSMSHDFLFKKYLSTPPAKVEADRERDNENDNDEDDEIE